MSKKKGRTAIEGVRTVIGEGGKATAKQRLSNGKAMAKQWQSNGRPIAVCTSPSGVTIRIGV